MNRRIAMVSLALLTTMSFAYGADPNYQGLLTKWETDFPKNDSHYIEITEAKEGQAGPYVCTTKAGKTWPCSAGFIQSPNGGPKTYTITFGEGSPYPGHVLHLVRDSDGRLTFLKQYAKGSDKELQGWCIRDGYQGLAGNYKEKSGGEMTIRRSNDAKREAGPWRFVLKGAGDWACSQGLDNPGGDKPSTFFISFAEGNFKGERYNIVRDEKGNVKQLELVGGSKAIWVKQ
jgi:hypothetical protein